MNSKVIHRIESTGYKMIDATYDKKEKKWVQKFMEAYLDRGFIEAMWDGRTYDWDRLDELSSKMKGD